MAAVGADDFVWRNIWRILNYLLHRSTRFFGAKNTLNLNKQPSKYFSGFTAVVCPLAEVQFGSCPPLLNFVNYS
jgi:hypothetical protein